MTMKVYMADLLSAILHTVQDGKLLAQHPLTAGGISRLCVYRCDNGYRCAIGCVLDDLHMKEVNAAELNGCAVNALLSGGIIDLPEGEGAIQTARLLQNCHDGCLSGSTMANLNAEPPGWMKPYASLCNWHYDSRGKPSSLPMFLRLVKAVGHEDWGSKEAA